MKSIFFVFLGGGIGSVLRYWVAVFSARLTENTAFPLGTFLVNAIGCFLMGALTATLMKSETPIKFLLLTGFCGGFTTFSAFSLENYNLWQNQQYVLLSIYILSSIVMGFIALALGYGMMKP